MVPTASILMFLSERMRSGVHLESTTQVLAQPIPLLVLFAHRVSFVKNWVPELQLDRATQGSIVKEVPLLQLRALQRVPQIMTLKTVFVIMARGVRTLEGHARRAIIVLLDRFNRPLATKANIVLTSCCTHRVVNVRKDTTVMEQMLSQMVTPALRGHTAELAALCRFCAQPVRIQMRQALFRSRAATIAIQGHSAKKGLQHRMALVRQDTFAPPVNLKLNQQNSNARKVTSAQGI
jgi:hypothetical protein